MFDNWILILHTIGSFFQQVPESVEAFNPYAWIGANILIAYISVILVIFTVFYFILFDPKATTAGKFIFRFVVSLVGVIGLIFIGSFIDPAQGRKWNEYPGDVIWWRPTIRLLIYMYVAYSVTALVVLLAIRKWAPQKLRTALDRQLVKPRRPDHEVNEDTLP